MTSLGALGTAFKGALEKPKYFRSMVQWSAMCNRYDPAAVAMGQLTWPLALAHLDQMSNWQKKNSFVVMVLQSLFVYTELLRKGNCKSYGME